MAEKYQEYDVVVVGSGAAGMLAAIRAHDQNLRSIVVEKTPYYGGTSAISGGEFWIPGNHLQENADSEALAREYLIAVSNGDIRQDLLDQYLSAGPAMVRYLSDIGIVMKPHNGIPDYYSDYPGSLGGRSLIVEPLDGHVALGDELFKMREASPVFRMLGRYSLTANEGGMLALRLPGWRKIAARIVFDYWRKPGWRLRTKRDRRLTLGNALVGSLRKAMLDRKIPLLLNTELVAIIQRSGERVTGASFRQLGQALTLHAKHGVILATGGFEHNQSMRDKHIPQPTRAEWSMAPGTNTGDGITVGETIGAATELLDEANWWPTTLLPSGETNTLQTHFMFRNPHSIIINRNGERYLDECLAYDRFGRAMIAEYQRTGSSIPSWIIFDATCRKNYLNGGLLPGRIRPDSTLPKEYWDTFVFKEDTIGALAGKIGVDAIKLQETVGRFNGFARSGKDLDFGRGETDYDRILGGGDPAVGPNPCLAVLEAAPFYAMKVFLGDLGTKGGLKTNANGQVVSTAGTAIESLYAAGNTAASIFRHSYPGAGTTLGPAMTFAFAAAEHLAAQAKLAASTPQGKREALNKTEVPT